MNVIERCNPAKLLAKPGPTLTISLTNDGLIIGDVPMPLEPRTIYNGVIFKPSEIVTKLSAYLTSNKLKSQKVTIILPTNINVSAHMLPFFVLQYTLVLSKTGIQITKVTTADQTENLLALLGRTNHQSPKLWLALTLISFGALGTTTWIKQSEATTNHTKLTDQEHVCKQTNTDYEKRYKETKKLKKSIDELEKKHAAAQIVLQKKYSPVGLLTTLAHQTPKSIWLTQVTLQEKSQRLDLSIKGVSFNTKTISGFLKNLDDKNSWIDNPRLGKVRKEKLVSKTPAKTKSTLYHFVIEGDMKN